MGLSAQSRRWVHRVALVLSSAWLVTAHADSDGCAGSGPLVVGSSATSSSVQAPAFLGEWRLPISSEDHDIMTEARVRVDLLKSPGGKGALVAMNFSFPDPMPWGLPFTFERAELSWESAGKEYSAQIDWSQNCSGPGRSMYPNEAWTALVEIPGDSTEVVLERPVFRVWGSRN